MLCKSYQITLELRRESFAFLEAARVKYLYNSELRKNAHLNSGTALIVDDILAFCVLNLSIVFFPFVRREVNKVELKPSTLANRFVLLLISHRTKTP